MWQFSFPRKKDLTQYFSLPKEEKKRRLLLFKSYIPDWILVILINIAGALFGLLSPHHRQFSLHNHTIQYSYHKDYLPNYVPPVVAYGAPVVSALMFLLFRRRNWHDFHCAVLAIFLGMGLNNNATNIIKNVAGRPRPDFIDRCKPNVTENPTLGLVDYRVCTQTDTDFLEEGMRSFPSGHASLAFCGLMFTSLYLTSHFRYNDHRGHAYKSVIFYFPLFCASLIAISRTCDNHHHWQDVLAGSIMGCYIGWFSYRTYFPPIFDPFILSDRPYPPRIPRPSGAAHLNYENGDIPPVDDDPYQMYNSSYLPTSMERQRPMVSNGGNSHFCCSHHAHCCSAAQNPNQPIVQYNGEVNSTNQTPPLTARSSFRNNRSDVDTLHHSEKDNGFQQQRQNDDHSIHVLEEGI